MSLQTASLRELTQQFTQAGTLQAIYLRPARGLPCTIVQTAEAVAQKGLIGDRSHAGISNNKDASKRQVTLIQAEHIAVISALIGKPVDAATLKRNLVVSNINLMAAKSLFKDQPMQLTIGEVILQVTGPCEPCSKTETALGHGGYNAMRGHGGMTAKIIKSGKIQVGDRITISPMQMDLF